MAKGFPIRAGRIEIPWDGYGSNGPLTPGIYLCKIHVSAEDPITFIRPLAIAY